MRGHDPTAGARTVRVAVMGDTGVGKSKLLEKICGGNSGSGLQVWAKAEKSPGGGMDLCEFIELDGGQGAHMSVRHPMFHQLDALMLVYDLTDDTSACSLQQWYESYVEFEGGRGGLQSEVSEGPFSTKRSTVHSRSTATRSSSGVYIPVCVVGTHLDAAHTPANPRSFCRRVSKRLLVLQRTLASVLRQALFLPMPSFLRSQGGPDVVLDSFRMRPNTRFLDWSCHDSSTREINDFLASVLENKQPSV
eukprot:TRINITY_DN23117_c0_g1_i1.p1 TRINITY_DN23117_c0_g1~~TRINITY_DN23117_c0_g1_i1.p1  ORF type:complete len:249 (+),score=23.24 TRINITY_DN23117_c0_g1_i1:34-780(+)